MRGKGITSGRRRHRPDGSYYRETRRRSLSAGERRLRVRLNWAAVTVAVVALVAIVVWMFR
jgi:hypothetical protein